MRNLGGGSDVSGSRLAVGGWQMGRAKTGGATPSCAVGGSRYKELAVYGLAVNLADELRAEIVGWSRLDRWSTGIQLLRAADSVGANVAEAFGRHGYPISVGFCT